jgi:hypothetical protein
LNKVGELKKLNTWGNRSSFEYKGSVKEGTIIFYGSGHSKFLKAAIYKKMLRHFVGRIVYCGTSRTDPQKGSLGEWLKANVSKTALASYVGAILVREGYAVKRGNRIEFL